MMRWIALLLALMGSQVFAETQLDDEGKPCESLVDLSEAGDFHRLHFECDKKPKVVTAYEAQPSGASTPAGQNKVATDDRAQVATGAGTEVLIRAPLPETGSILKALDPLYQQMRQHCPNGWDKNNEWAARDQQQLYLHIRLTCR